MPFFEWLNEKLFGSVSGKATPDRPVQSDGRAPRGYWFPAPAAQPSPIEEDDEYKRNYVYPKMSLHELLDLFGGDLAEAIVAKGLDPHIDETGNVIAIGDRMTRGNLTDDEFALLRQLRRLRRLSLRGTRLSDRGLAALAELPQLEELLLENFWGYHLSDEALVHLAHLPGLKEFSLDRGTATGVGLRHVANPQSVESLSFDNTPITDEGLAVIGGFPNLQRLRLWRDAKVSNEGLKELQKLSRLREIDLTLCSCQEITDEGVRHLRELPELESLALGDTNVTDACVDDVLRMKKIARVSFGDEKVSLESVERLRSAGIEVEHGTLKGFRRESNVLRYLDIDFGIDQERSALRAYLHPDRNDVTWELEVDCLDEFVPEHHHPAHLEGPPIHFDRPWRELEGEEFRINFDESKLHPIMPGNPGNIYVGWHACPNNHVIRFLQRRGALFLIEWTCTAKQSARDEGSAVYLHGEIAFREVIVWSDKPLAPAEARQMAARYFDMTELGEPEIDAGRRDTRYRFPVNAVV